MREIRKLLSQYISDGIYKISMRTTKKKQDASERYRTQFYIQPILSCNILSSSRMKDKSENIATNNTKMTTLMWRQKLCVLFNKISKTHKYVVIISFFGKMPCICGCKMLKNSDY